MILRLLIVGILLVSAIAGYKYWLTEKSFSVLHEAPFDNAVGPEDAEITLVEIVDYRCSFCREVHPILKEFHEKNPDVRIVFRHLIIFGEPSLHAAQVALAAGIQGHFEKAHNDLMTRDEPVTDDYIDQIATDLGLDVEKFKKDLKSPPLGNFFLDNIDATENLDINGTPTFIIGKRIFKMEGGMPTVETFEKLVAEERAK